MNSTIGSMPRRRASCSKPISAITEKNCSNRRVAQIDDGGAPLIGDQPVEQRHLAAGIGDIDGPDQIGEIGAKRRLARIEIVADQRGPPA